MYSTSWERPLRPPSLSITLSQTKGRDFYLIRHKAAIAMRLLEGWNTVEISPLTPSRFAISAVPALQSLLLKAHISNSLSPYSPYTRFAREEPNILSILPPILLNHRSDLSHARVKFNLAREDKSVFAMANFQLMLEELLTLSEIFNSLFPVGTTAQ